MGIVFATRGKFTARYGANGTTGKVWGTTPYTEVSDGTAISGFAIYSGGTNNSGGLVWQGRGNCPNGRALSMLARVKCNFTGSPANSRTVLPGLCFGGGRGVTLEFANNSSGNIVAFAKNEANVTIMSTVNMGAYARVANQWDDFFMSWDGTTTANSFKVYVNATLLGQATPSAAWASGLTNENFSEIVWGSTSGTASLFAASGSTAHVDEIVIWDSVVDCTSITLDSGTGSLNGSSRTSLVTVSAFDGTTNTDPTEALVKSGTAYTIAGVAKTGTYAPQRGAGG